MDEWAHAMSKMIDDRALSGGLAAVFVTVLSNRGVTLHFLRNKDQNTVACYLLDTMLQQPSKYDIHRCTPGFWS